MSRAAGSSAGLPRTISSISTSVSAARIQSSGWRAAAAAAFSQAKRTAASGPLSAGAIVSSTSGGLTVKGMPRFVRISTRRGEADARMRDATGNTP